MRANQAAIQRRVNTPRVQQNQSTPQTPQQTSSTSYAPYPPQQPQQFNNFGQSPSNNTNPNQPQPQTPGRMPQGLNPQQQLQFILNVLGERISKLEVNVAQISNNPSDIHSSASTNPSLLQNAITNHPEIKNIKESLSKIISQPSSIAPSQQQSTVSPDMIAEIQTNIDTLFEQVENNDKVNKIQEELQIRTELLTTEIVQIKDMVLQLQNTVINTLLPAIVSSQPLPPAPFPFQPASTLESFTEAPLNIIPEDPSIAAAVLEENLEIAELPTLSEPLTYQES
jgi:hypothetical protein